MSVSSAITKDQFDICTWNVVDSYFQVNKGYQLVKHQLESFNDFVLRKIEQIIDGFNDIDIYHHFINEVDKKEVNKFKYLLKIEIKNPVLGKPVIFEKDGSTKLMTPNDARQRNFTYSSPLYVDIHVTAKTYQSQNENSSSDDEQEYLVEKKTLNNVLLGKVPIMVRSNYCVLRNAQHTKNECRYDYGGYFIINGNEKVIISQDRISENKTYVFVNNKISTYSHIAEIRSVQENKLGVPKITTLKLSSRANQFGRYIRVNIHHIKNDIPLFILFKALGLNNDKEIIRYIVHDIDSSNYLNTLIINELIGCIEEANQVMCPKAALEYLSRYLNITGYPKEVLNNKHQRINIIRNILEKEFLPHVGKDFQKKALYLGYMVNKLIKCFLGLKEFDDRDSYINKRVDTPGVLMANLFRQYYGKVIKDMKNMIQKEINTGGWKATNKFINVINKVNVSKIIKSTIIDSGMRYALATGNWGIKSNKNKQGVAQVLNRMTYSATLSHLRRINTPIEKSGKLVQPRKLHSTQWGIICPSETPEGASVGLVKNMAMMASITISSNSTSIRELVTDLGTSPFNSDNIDLLNKHTKVIINGDIVGTHDKPFDFFWKLKMLKRKGCINIYTGIVWNIRENEINICTEGGRCVRPLYIVQDNNIKLSNNIATMLKGGKMSWQDLVIGESVEFDIDDSIVEFLDVEEANTSMIAIKYQDLFKGAKGSLLPVKYTHLEIHPSLMLGVLASLIPFSDHNQAPRNCYQSAQCKQAIGIYSLNYQDRYDTIGHILNYPQKPLIKTRMSTILNNDHMPNGINVIVAIATYTGFNQEDSVIVNKSAVDRGLFTSTYYKTYKEQNNKNHSNGEEEFNKKPSETKSNKPYNYDKLEEDGFVQENTYVQTGDIIIGKCMPNKNGSVITYKDNSVPLKNNERGFIDRNCYNDKYFSNTNGDGYTFCKVRIRSDRIPTIGDKFSSRSGQKGTCGILYRQEDMPFTKDGIVPDIIMNPHAIPSRMTIGQLLECVMGKACTKLGSYGDATPFTDLSVEEISKILRDECGLEPYGNEILYNSRTGEQMNTEIFIGPTYYQRLKHMTIDKIHCLTPDHDVLTDKGWVPISNVEHSHRVATLKNGCLVYDHPIDVLHYPKYSGKMYHISNSSIDLNVTMNHRMWVSRKQNNVWQPYNLQQAEGLIGKQVRYQKNANWCTTNYQFVLPTYEGCEAITVDMDPWLVFFGVWISEGWAHNGKTLKYCTSICINKQRIKDVIFDAVNKLGLDYKVSYEKLHIYNKQLHAYMKTLSVGAHHKRLPDWVWCLSSSQCQTLIHNMCLGDGTFAKNGCCMFYTSSTGLADDFMRLCLHAGWSSTKGVHIPKGQTTYIKGRAITNNNVIWRLPVITSKNTPAVNHGHHHQQNIQVESIYDYNGPVHCLQVPSEIFYVRRNGKSCWTGNSRSSSGPIVLLTRQPAEGRARDGGLRMGEMEIECNWSHGIQQFLKERVMECSDNYRVFICKHCGMIATVNPDKGLYSCKPCKNTTNFSEVRIPYAAKLLFQEIQTMGIGARFIT